MVTPFAHPAGSPRATVLLDNDIVQVELKENRKCTLLTTQATQTLVCSLQVLSHLDYCNSLLSGCPMQFAGQTSAARLVCKAKK